MFLSLNYIQSDLHGWVWPWKTKPSLINDESLVSFNIFIELFRSRAQITEEKKYRIGSPTFKILTNTKCFPEIHHFHLKNLGITISQTLMATNSPLFSMMFTVTWDTRCQLIGWLVRVEVEQHSTENIYLPSRCWGIANATRVLQPLVHHSFSLLGVLLEPIVIPVLLAGRPLKNYIWWEIWWEVFCCFTCRNLPNSIPSTRAMPSWLVTYQRLVSEWWDLHKYQSFKAVTCKFCLWPNCGGQIYSEFGKIKTKFPSWEGWAWRGISQIPQPPSACRRIRLGWGDLPLPW